MSAKSWCLILLFVGFFYSFIHCMHDEDVTHYDRLSVEELLNLPFEKLKLAPLAVLEKIDLEAVYDYYRSKFERQLRAAFSSESEKKKAVQFKFIKKLPNKKLFLDKTYNELEGRTPLYWVSKFGYIDYVRAFLSEGAEVNFKDEMGETALTAAIKAGNDEIRDLLLSRGAKISQLDSELFLAKKGEQGLANKKSSKTSRKYGIKGKQGLIERED